VGAIKERERKLAITNEISAIFDHISAPRQKFKNLAGNFFNIKMRSLYAKFQPSSFKTEEEDRG